MKLEKEIINLLNGDKKAFKTIYDNSKHAVFAIVIPIVKDKSLAEDIMQETYIKMLEKLETYDKNQKFINWILTIAKNTALDHYKKNKKTLYVDVNENEDLFLSTDKSNILESEYYLSFLNDQEKEIVLLKVVGGLKHKDISSLLKIPIGTSTSLYKRAIDKMQKISKKEEN